jgi:hypothetical protein
MGACRIEILCLVRPTIIRLKVACHSDGLDEDWFEASVTSTRQVSTP